MTSGKNNAGISDGGLRVTALTIDQIAQVLSNAAGRKVTTEMIQLDIDAGAPTNPDGTINLINYTAWLVGASVDGA